MTLVPELQVKRIVEAQRGFIAEVGKDPGPGQAILFGTTPLFLERLGINSLDQLPQLSDFVPGADVVEALEVGLRPPPGPSLGERLDEIEGYHQE